MAAAPEAWTVSGRVLGPDGQPVAGARLFVCDSAGKHPAPQPATGADGYLHVLNPAWGIVLGYDGEALLAHRFGTRRLLTFDERDFRTLRSVTGASFTLLPADSGDKPRRRRAARR